jgi:methyltransferase (TIGR00027 family)
MHDPLIRSITDTARWVAYQRAEESERPDALFSDPYARKLAGERGELIGKQMNNAMYIAVRTLLIDTLILEQLARIPIDMVVNLAAGLDSRAYRLKLPPNLRWVEVDLPEIVEIKKTALAGEQTNCMLDVVALDLAEAPLRQRLLSQLDAQATLAMAVSEGLLMYLTQGQVTELAANIHAQSHFQYWIVEVVSRETIKWVQRKWGSHLDAAGAPMIFAPDNWEDFYVKRGWKTVDFRDISQHAVKCGRVPSPSALPPKMKDTVHAILKKLQGTVLRGSGVALLQKI